MKLGLAVFFALAGTVSALVPLWVYVKKVDPLTDKITSSAMSFAAEVERGKTFHVAFQCSGGRVRFQINVDTAIHSTNTPFSLAYRVDKREARKLVMRTFSNDGRGGFTYDGARQLADDFRSGQTVFLRATTSDNRNFDATVPLDEAGPEIDKVFADCGVRLDPASPEPAYSLELFNADFRNLSAVDQRILLDELRQLMKKKGVRQ